MALLEELDIPKDQIVEKSMTYMAMYERANFN